MTAKYRVEMEVEFDTRPGWARTSVKRMIKRVIRAEGLRTDGGYSGAIVCDGIVVTDLTPLPMPVNITRGARWECRIGDDGWCDHILVNLGGGQWVVAGIEDGDSWERPANMAETVQSFFEATAVFTLVSVGSGSGDSTTWSGEVDLGS